MALSLLAFEYYFVTPSYSLTVEIKEIPRLFIFALSALFVGSLSAALNISSPLPATGATGRGLSEDFLFPPNILHYQEGASPVKQLIRSGEAPSRPPSSCAWALHPLGRRPADRHRLAHAGFDRLQRGSREPFVGRQRGSLQLLRVTRADNRHADARLGQHPPDSQLC